MALIRYIELKIYKLHAQYIQKYIFFLTLKSVKDFFMFAKKTTAIKINIVFDFAFYDGLQKETFTDVAIH